jgi:FlaG/FlaF family flagellin (archaellin)
MKAVSAFIATVLIIAFTIGVAGVISKFVYDMAKEQTDVTGESSDKQAKCGDSALIIDEVKTDSDLNPVNVTFTYSSGTEDLYNFTVYIIDSGKQVNSTSSFIQNFTQTNPLRPGRTVFWNISTTYMGLSGSLSSVRIVGLCQQDYIISASCNSGNVCMKS